jgi:hypothetical protein
VVARTLVAGLALAAAATSCADDPDAREALLDEAVASGIDEDLATCLVDGLFTELGPERAEEVIVNEDFDDLPDEDRAILSEVEEGCVGDVPAPEEPGVSIESVPPTIGP